MTYEMVNKLWPENFFNTYLPRFLVSKYNTRHCRDLQVTGYRTEFAKRELPILNSFKKQLKTYLKG